jgi:MinD-like ATPase involved in chromosome partitioning or flagellar assembly
MQLLTWIFWGLFFVFSHIIVFDIGMGVNETVITEISSLKQQVIILQDKLNDCKAVKAQQNLTIRRMIVKNYIEEK